MENAHKWPQYACAHPVEIHVLRLTSLPQYKYIRSQQNYLKAAYKPEQHYQLGCNAVLASSNTSMLPWNLHLKY